MKKVLLLSGVLCLVISSVSFADTFAAGTANEFSIDFIPISGDTNPTSGYGIVNNDYRMGIYEITNAQWAALRNSLGVPVTGSPSYAYDESPYFTGASVPTTEVSWYEAAQFVNWLNIDAGYDPAYQFTGTQGTGDYTLTVWDGTDTGYDASNPYRNSGAHYFLPTEDEWVKAAYWNGTNLQTWATVGDVTPTQAGWNFDDGYATEPYGPWAVGSGSEELNGTFDMMGNVWEWMENPYSGGYTPGSKRNYRGGSYYDGDYGLTSNFWYTGQPYNEIYLLGFRVASVPEPCSLVLLSIGGLMLRRRKNI